MDLCENCGNPRVICICSPRRTAAEVERETASLRRPPRLTVPYGDPQPPETTLQFVDPRQGASLTLDVTHQAVLIHPPPDGWCEYTIRGAARMLTDTLTLHAMPHPASEPDA